MTEILLLHHAQGQTRGFLEFADALRAAGHVVHAPDLYDGKTFTDLNEGVGYAREVGFGTIVERGQHAAEGLPNELVYAGFSLGVMPAQMLAQTRSGAKGALLLSAALPASEFGGTWPPGVPLQIHMMEDDEWAAEDLPAARELVETTEGAELFLYPGEGHLFADRSLSDYDERSHAARATRPRIPGGRRVEAPSRDACSASRLGGSSGVSGLKGSDRADAAKTLLMVWRREPDRRWRIARELLTEDVCRSGERRGAASGDAPERSHRQRWCGRVSCRSVRRTRARRGSDRSRSPASPCRDTPPTGRSPGAGARPRRLSPRLWRRGVVVSRYAWSGRASMSSRPLSAASAYLPAS